MSGSAVRQQCIRPSCGTCYGVQDVLFRCRNCGSLLDVEYDWACLLNPPSRSSFDARRAHPPDQTVPAIDGSGVWRFRELLPFAEPDELVTIGEGATMLNRADRLARFLGAVPGALHLQYEGFNPSGSFKDNGMAAALTMARKLNRRRVACASTGNTSASLALFAARTETSDGRAMEGIVFVGGGRISLGKLAQALDHGATTIQIEGDFDVCMNLVRESAEVLDLYVVNSINPFRLEGQKTIMYRVLEGLHWNVPDWIVVPGGNLGNASSFGKAFHELKTLGLVDRIPRLAVINAAGANALDEFFNGARTDFDAAADDPARIDRFFERRQTSGLRAKTVASAIEIGRPVNLLKALRSLKWMNGVVRSVRDEDILDARALVGRYGLGCEPASAASVAGYASLLAEGTIRPDDKTVCILTGHELKDPGVVVNYHNQTGAGSAGLRFVNRPHRSGVNIEDIAAILNSTADKQSI